MVLFINGPIVSRLYNYKWSYCTQVYNWGKNIDTDLKDDFQVFSTHVSTIYFVGSLLQDKDPRHARLLQDKDPRQACLLQDKDPRHMF